MNNTVTFDRRKRQLLRKEYNKAIKTGATYFYFEGHQILDKYAKYLLEYLDSVIK